MVKKNFEDDPNLKALWEKENMVSKGTPFEWNNFLIIRIQLGRISEPSEYRGAALFCLSDASTFMTGSQMRESIPTGDMIYELH
jgi:hypothetical protein